MKHFAMLVCSCLCVVPMQGGAQDLAASDAGPIQKSQFYVAFNRAQQWADNRYPKNLSMHSHANRHYRVRKGDTLTKIAADLKPVEISLDIMLVALYRANPDAFNGKNMNRLKAGQILSVPDSESIKGTGQGEARGLVVAHAADFNAYRNRLARQVVTAAPDRAPEVIQSAAGKITAKVEERPTNANESKKKLLLSKALGANDASDKRATDTSDKRAAVSAKEKIAKEQALADATARVKELERNVRDLEKLMTVKSKAGADAQELSAVVNAAPATVVGQTKIGIKPAPSPPDVVPAFTQPLRQVEFMFATTRAEVKNSTRVAFSGERGATLQYGAARVRIPEDHKIGSIELPSKYTLLTLEVYEQKRHPNSHFVIKGVSKLSEDAWYKALQSVQSDEALVFVHGYNTSFDASLYRMAQIVWDLQYKGKAVLFSWASRGSMVHYPYDQQSAIIGSAMFADLLKKLSKTPGIKRLHILAHSMGNLVMMEGLKAEATSSDPIRIAELIMAAPDLDRDYYQQNAAKIRKLASGMTLYASSSDKAMQASRSLAGGVPRAGDVPAAGPIVLAGIETIDVTSVGSDLLGLNHDAFASRRQVMNDIGLLLSSQPRKLPHQRLVADILGMPEGIVPPRYWRYAR